MRPGNVRPLIWEQDTFIHRKTFFCNTSISNDESCNVGKHFNAWKPYSYTVSAFADLLNLFRPKMSQPRSQEAHQIYSWTYLEDHTKYFSRPGNRTRVLYVAVQCGNPSAMDAIKAKIPINTNKIALGQDFVLWNITWVRMERPLHTSTNFLLNAI